jgi:hypothetical protein
MRNLEARARAALAAAGLAPHAVDDVCAAGRQYRQSRRLQEEFFETAADAELAALFHDDIPFLISLARGCCEKLARERA